jgi:hypothetical protein
MSGAELTWTGGRVSRAAALAAEVGLRHAAEHLRGVSQQAAPIDEGTLRASAAVTVLNGGTRVAVSYNTPYAARQHEELGWRHPKGGRAKYLEGPAHEEDATMRAIIATEVRKAAQ